MKKTGRDGTCLILLLVGLLLPLGCQSETTFGPIRATTMAPDLEYLPKEKLRTAMWVLAAEIEHLERVMTDPSEDEREELPSVVAGTLERMRIAALTLDQPGRATQHPVLNQNLVRFLERLDRAKRAVERDPPNYFPASTVAGSCFLCHGRISGTVQWTPDSRSSKS